MNQKILLVDDSSTARKLCKICLMDYTNYDIIEANEWKSALEMAKTHRPVLIIMDYNMPEKTGADIAKLMQAEGIQARYVLLTANTQQSIINEVKALGFFDILEKPVTPDIIKSLMDQPL